MPQLTAPLAQRLPLLDINFYNHPGHLAWRTLKIFLFVLKAVSLNMFCAPMAANTMVAYSLVALAAFDLASIKSGPGTSIFLLILHVAILLAASWAGVLCMSMDYWQKL